MTIITLSAGSIRASRTEAEEIIREALTHDQRPTRLQLESLLLYFQPKPAKPKNAEDWVRRLVAVRDVRQGLNYCYSDGRRFMATDGKALAWCETEREVGYYHPVTLDAVAGVDWKYPDVDRVIPDVPREDDWIPLADLWTGEQRYFKRNREQQIKVGEFWYPCHQFHNLIAGRDGVLVYPRERHNDEGRLLAAGLRGKHEWGGFVVSAIWDDA